MEFLLVTYDTSDYYWQNNTPVHNPDEFWFRYYESDTNVPIDNIGVGDWVVVKSRNGLGVARVLKKAKDNPEFSALLTEYETLKSQTEGSYE